MLRKILFTIAILLLLVLVWTGISGGMSQLASAKTAGQTIQTVFQFVYAGFALLSIATTFWARRWNRLMLVCWMIALAFAGGIASVAWGGTSAIVGLVSGVAAGPARAGGGRRPRSGGGARP